MNYKLLDPDENGEGEVATFGRNVFMGYIWEEKKTKEALTDDGEFWMKSGDIGRYGKVVSFRDRIALLSRHSQKHLFQQSTDTFDAHCIFFATTIVLACKCAFIYRGSINFFPGMHDLVI